MLAMPEKAIKLTKDRGGVDENARLNAMMANEISNILETCKKFMRSVSLKGLIF